MDPPRAGLHLTEWACELVGTAILLTGGLSAVAVDFGSGSPLMATIPSASLRLLLTGAVFAGTGSLVAISPLGRRSGAHLNPAVTLAFWLTRHVHMVDLIGYWAAQFAGGLLGAAVVAAVWDGLAASVHDGVTQPGPGISPLGAAGIEALMTAILVLTIFVFVARARTMRLTPLAVWVTVTMLVWLGAPLTGTSLNPARTLGPALVTGSLSSVWVYFLGPLAGAAAVATVAHASAGRLWPVTAKLFHDVRYRSVFGTHPAAPAAGLLR